MRPAGKEARDGTTRLLFGRRRGGSERKTNLTYVFVSGDKPLANWPRVAKGESVIAFLCLFIMSDLS